MPVKITPGTKALRKGRFSQPNGIYFVTIVTEERLPWFSQFDLACVMCRSIKRADETGATRILCWVVMPDHVHLLVEMGEEELSSVIRRLKSGSAVRLNRQIGRKGRFWLPGFHDRGLRREESIKDFARYIIANPLRAKLTKKYGNYPFWDAVWLNQ